MRRRWIGSLLLGGAITAAACGGGDGTSSPDNGGASSGALPPSAPTAPPEGSELPGEPPVVGTFPKDFVFGSAIAGFQVDMGCPTIAAASCEDRASDWYQWITTKRIVDNPVLFMSKDPPSSGPGFYELFQQDVERAGGRGAAQLGTGALRLSIEWSRIFPKATWGIGSHASLRAIASAEGIAFYHQLFASMKARGMKPFGDDRSARADVRRDQGVRQGRRRRRRQRGGGRHRTRARCTRRSSARATSRRSLRRSTRATSLRDRSRARASRFRRARVC